MSYGTYPSTRFTAITPSDTAKITAYEGENNINNLRCRGIFVGGAGDIVIKDDMGNSITFVGCVAGSILAISTDQVMATGTTATNLVALF